MIVHPEKSMPVINQHSSTPQPSSSARQQGMYLPCGGEERDDASSFKRAVAEMSALPGPYMRPLSALSIMTQAAMPATGCPFSSGTMAVASMYGRTVLLNCPAQAAEPVCMRHLHELELPLSGWPAPDNKHGSQHECSQHKRSQDPNKAYACVQP